MKQAAFLLVWPPSRRRKSPGEWVEVFISFVSIPKYHLKCMRWKIQALTKRCILKTSSSQIPIWDMCEPPCSYRNGMWTQTVQGGDVSVDAVYFPWGKRLMYSQLSVYVGEGVVLQMGNFSINFLKATNVWVLGWATFCLNFSETYASFFGQSCWH